MAHPTAARHASARRCSAALPGVQHPHNHWTVSHCMPSARGQQHRCQHSMSALRSLHGSPRSLSTRIHTAAAAAATQTVSPSTQQNSSNNNSAPQRPSVMSVRNLTFHPPGVPSPLLDNINMEVPPNSLGLIIGRSGSGKTTLLQVLAGLCEQQSGTIHIAKATPGMFSLNPPTASSSAAGVTPSRGAKFAARMSAENRPVRPASPGPSSPQPATPGVTVGSLLAGAASVPAASMEERMSKVGLVFQFPERHFLGSDVFTELTFTWPRDPTFFLQQQALRARVVKVLQAVRLADVDMSMSPWSLSGGQQRRLALAIQLIRQPSVMLLDEPLAGLDWQARQEVIELLTQLKKQCSLLVVSHDLREVSPLVDCAWVMRPGGRMERLDSWPPPGGFDQLNAAAKQLQ